jgi:Ser/Thr protein kinase RdoA (MazF antagonist)
MTKDGSFKKIVRRHAEATGQRYTEALTDLEGLSTRMDHQPNADRLLAHLNEHYGIAGTAVTQISIHNSHVFRIDRGDGEPWVARAFPPARPKAGVEGDAAILRFLAAQGYPAERLAVDDAVSGFGDSTVLVTKFVPCTPLPGGPDAMAIMADLLGQLHALPVDESAMRPGGASGDDPSREGSPRQDLLAALAFLDAVATKVAVADRDQFEQIRETVRSADDGEGLPEALLHGNLMHSPDHAVVSEQGPVAINWKASGRGPRMADFAFLMWGTWLDEPSIDAAVSAYRQHIEVTDDELDRFAAAMSIRPLYLMAFEYRRYIDRGQRPQVEWFDPEYIAAAAAATRKAFAR